MVKIVGVYCFEYDMKESSWKAYVAGFSQDEAFAKLTQMIDGKITKVKSVNYMCKLDAISDQMAVDVAKPYVDAIKKNIKKVAKETVDTPKESTVAKETVDTPKVSTAKTYKKPGPKPKK